MTTVCASLTNLTVLRTQSHDCSYYAGRRILEANKQRQEPTRCNKWWFIGNQLFLNMFRASLRPSSGQQTACHSLPMVFCPVCSCCGSGESGSVMCALWKGCCLTRRSDCRNMLTYAHTTPRTDLWHQLRLANVTCAWCWNLCGNNPAIGLYTRMPTVNWACKKHDVWKQVKFTPDTSVCSASCSDFTPRRDPSISTAQEAGWTPELVFHSAAQTEIRFAYKNLQQSLRNLRSDCGIYGHTETGHLACTYDVFIISIPKTAA